MKGRTLLLITHRPPLLARQRIMLIDKGKVVADGPRDEVLQQITPARSRQPEGRDGTRAHLEDLADRIRPRAASNLLLWVVVGFVVVFFVWAAFAELDRTVRGPGRVIASSQLQTVSNLEGGVVEADPGQDRPAGERRAGADPARSAPRPAPSSAAAKRRSARSRPRRRGCRPRCTAASRSIPPARHAVVAAQIQIERALHASRMAELASLVDAGQARISQASARSPRPRPPTTRGSPRATRARPRRG